MLGNPKEIIRRAQVLLQDATGVRWPAAELVGYLNEGQRQLATARPSESSVVRDYAMADGAEQALPDDAFLLLDVNHNSTGRYRAITKVERKTLESVARDWIGKKPTDATVHYMYSELEPDVFYVYPPGMAGASLKATFAVYPQDVGEPTGPTWADVAGATGLAARWDAALLDYVLYRAWSKDAEYAANEQRASAHLGMFTTSVSVQAAPAKT